MKTDTTPTPPESPVAVTGSLARRDRCWTCGKARGLAMQRKSWGLQSPTVLVPRTGNDADKPAQMINDLIVNAGVWRNGGCAEDTHLCDDCLRIGLRHIKLKVDACLEVIEADTDKDAELAAIHQTLGRTQHEMNNLQHDHNRMQERMAGLVKLVEKHAIDGGDLLNSCRWEVRRGPVARVK